MGENSTGEICDEADSESGTSIMVNGVHTRAEQLSGGATRSHHSTSTTPSSTSSWIASTPHSLAALRHTYHHDDAAWRPWSEDSSELRVH